MGVRLSMAGKVRLDIDGLIKVLINMKDDGFVTTDIAVTEGDSEPENELSVSAVDIESDESVPYGNIASIIEDI